MDRCGLITFWRPRVTSVFVEGLPGDIGEFDGHRWTVLGDTEVAAKQFPHASSYA